MLLANSVFLTKHYSFWIHNPLNPRFTMKQVHWWTVAKLLSYSINRLSFLSHINVPVPQSAEVVIREISLPSLYPSNEMVSNFSDVPGIVRSSWQLQQWTNRLSKKQKIKDSRGKSYCIGQGCNTFLWCSLPLSFQFPFNFSLFNLK